MQQEGFYVSRGSSSMFLWNASDGCEVGKFFGISGWLEEKKKLAKSNYLL
jgi:hypothetical protein